MYVLILCTCVNKTPSNARPHPHCLDEVQEHSARFTYYLFSAHLNWCTYWTREQVELFLKGHETEFAPSVKYVGTLIDSWGKDRLNPKCEICHLACTTEAYMKTYVETIPTMCPAKLPDITTEDILDMLWVANHREAPKKEKPEPTEGPGKSVDVHCDACGTHGQRWQDNDFMAKLIKSPDFITNLEPSKSKNLLETFQKEQLQKNRQNKRMQWHARHNTLNKMARSKLWTQFAAILLKLVCRNAK